ncbi:MAG TPA: DPP IV N-terminal domain-containing protein [Pyrinomonadaceae bacterium]|jgi:Tol biopolymer transport system component/C-terminal processing protease CtpA/Prc|nr:DPP IV N-terminal domain-containing protein [Pyrinomonadaceae bacterium]
MFKSFGTCVVAAMLLVSGLCVPAARAQQGLSKQAAPRPYFYEPAISPDRREIAFVSGGDIWTVPAEGGEARLLVSHPATESRPLYSPDGQRLAFISTRTGNGDIYVLDFASGELKRLTFDDGFEQLDSWSYDGKWIYFSSTARDIAGSSDIYRVSADGGTPMPVSADRYANEWSAAPSPNGADLAFVGRGFAQWWRHGHAHIDESVITLMRNHSTDSYKPLTQGGAKEVWPMWGDAGRSLYFMSDRSGAENLWKLALGGQPVQVTKFTDGRVLWPCISYDGRTIVFERGFGIWRLDAETGRTSEVSITRRGVPVGPAVDRVSQGGQFQDLALSPDGKKVAFVARGEIFAASATDGGDATRVTTTPAPESQPTWAPDSRRLAYVSRRNGAGQIFLYDFATNAETQLTSGSEGDDTPRFSPDGKWLAFERAGREIRALNLEAKREHVVAAGGLERPPLSADRPFIWSPDSRWIAYMPVGQKLFRNVFVVRADGSGTPQPVSFLANGGSDTVSWSPDGTFILFDTGQRTEQGQLARVDLIPRTPKFREDQFRDLFKEETPKNVSPTLRRQENNPQSPVPPTETPVNVPTPTPTTTPTPADAPATQTPGQTPTPTPAPMRQGLAGNASTQGGGSKEKPVEIVFDGIRRRLSLLPVGVDVIYQTVSPDGKNVLMIASAVNQTNLYVFPLEELPREPAVTRQLTSTPGFKTDAQFSPDGKEVFYLENGRIQVAPLDPRQPAHPLAVAAEMDVDFAREKLEVFEQGWEYMRDNFFDAKYNGADWQAVRGEFLPYVAGAGTPEEVRRLMRLMVGELNASHLGVSGPFGSTPVTTGRLGLDFEREEYERNGRLRVSSVIPLSPAALARDSASPERLRPVKVGDYILSVDGKQLDARTNLDELLSYKIGRRVAVVVASSAGGADRKELDIRPVNLATEKGLRYREWVEEKRAYVERVSGGRLGYVHMPDMSSNSLAQLYVDLDAENQSKEGVVVDIRHNDGGFVNVYAIDVLARRSYLRMTPRGLSTSPARTALGQRALELPTVLLTDQYSLSDAEDFAEGYRSLHLGKVVGEPTAGWIIYTSSVQLVDGTVFRLPFIRIQTAEGADMEHNPRPVDVTVTRPIGESYTGHDSQLDAAVRELLGRR